MSRNTAAPMTPEQLTGALAQLGMTQTDYARLIDVSPKTIWMWTSGRTAIPKLAQEHLDVLLALDSLHKQFTGRLKPKASGEPPEATGANA